MVHQEHDDHTEQGAKEGDPLVVIPGIQCHNLFCGSTTHLKLGLQPGDLVMLA